MHLPYHESDHVLGIAYNVLCGGTCLQDIELRRQDEVYLDALGAQRIPDPTTAGDFCRRFDEAAIEALQAAINETRRAGLARATGRVLRRGDHRRRRHAGRDDGRVQGRDGHRLQRRVGLSPVGRVAGQHAGAVVSGQPERQSAVGGGRGRAVRSGADAVSRGGLPADHVPRRHRFLADAASGSVGRRRRAVRVWLRCARESDPRGRRVAGRARGRRWCGARRTRSRPSRGSGP